MFYRTLKVSFWRDPKVRQLDPVTKLLFLYFITNEHSHVSGLYYLPVTLIEHETGIKGIPLRKGMDNLSKGYLVRFDPENDTVWVVNMLRHQTSKTGISPKIKAAVTSQLSDLSNSSTINEFLEFYKDLSIPYRNPIDTPSIPYRKGIDTLSKSEDEDEDEDVIEEEGGEPDSAGSPQAPVITLPLHDGSEHPVSPAEATEMQRLYPAADVEAEFRKMRGWLLASPNRRKTKAGIRRFIASWLGRAQDRGGIKVVYPAKVNGILAEALVGTEQPADDGYRMCFECNLHGPNDDCPVCHGKMRYKPTESEVNA